MKKYLVIILLSITTGFSQSFKVEKISGSVKMLSENSNTWQQVKLNMDLNESTILSTEKNSTVIIRNQDLCFTLTELSAITISNIKKMSMDELLLALAMENVMNTPRKNGNEKSDNTGVYGDKISDEIQTAIKSNDFGLKRLNGAKQLAESGFIESAIIASKEIYRKYPETKNYSSFRIYFTDLLFDKGLYEESYDEYKQIKSLQLNNAQQNYLNNKLEEIGKKLLNN